VKKTIVAFIILAGSALQNGWGQPVQPSGDAQYDQAQFNQGRSVFDANCRVCHIVKSQGDQPSPYYLRFRPGDFSDPDFWKTHDDAKIEKAVNKGKGAMPPQRLSPEELKALLHFMHLEFRK
jgi:mono/diheme cytochrome c family protein